MKSFKVNTGLKAGCIAPDVCSDNGGTVSCPQSNDPYPLPVFEDCKCSGGNKDGRAICLWKFN